MRKTPGNPLKLGYPMPRLDAHTQQTADYWDARGAGGFGGRKMWWDLEPVLRHRNRLLSGDEELGFEAYLARRYFQGRSEPRRLELLSLGCGRGNIDRRLAAHLPVRRLVGMDIAEQNLAHASREAANLPSVDFEYRRADLNHEALEASSYDVVVAAGILHHLSRLEHVFDQVSRCLRPGGLLFLDEYVGPNRFQFPPAQRDCLSEAFAGLPPRLRHHYVAPGHRNSAALSLRMLQPRLLWAKLRSGRLGDAIRYRLGLLRSSGDAMAPPLERPRLPTAADVAAGDPSEAVRSSEIIPLLRQRFEVIEAIGTGLTLLQFLLADIAHHFIDAQDIEAQAELQRLIDLESELLANGTLEHDFVFAAARRKER